MQIQHELILWHITSVDFITLVLEIWHYFLCSAYCARTLRSLWRHSRRLILLRTCQNCIFYSKNCSVCRSPNGKLLNTDRDSFNVLALIYAKEAVHGLCHLRLHVVWLHGIVVIMWWDIRHLDKFLMFHD